MARRAFDRYMVSIGMGTHPKLATLTDSEFRAHVVGVLAIAAMAPIRGRLLVGSLPAEPVHVARTAGVTEKVATGAMRKLMAIGVLMPDAEYDCLRVHDWEDVNPPPKSDRTNALRQRQFRARNASDNAPVTPDVTVLVTPPEVEVEVRSRRTTNTNTELRSAVIECFAYWQERCGHPQAQLSSDRRGKIEARIRERSKLAGGIPEAIRDIRSAIDGAARSPYIDDNGKRFDDIELICRNGSKLEDFMGRAGPAFAPGTPTSRDGTTGRATVVPLRVVQRLEELERIHPEGAEGA